MNLDDIRKKYNIPADAKIAQVCRGNKVLWEDPVEMFKIRTSKVIDNELKNSDLKEAKSILTKIMDKK